MVVEVSSGCLTSSLVHPPAGFREAVLARSAALILFHNHPSGDPEPSDEDLAPTRRLCSPCALVGIPLLAHVSLASSRCVRLPARGLVLPACS